MATAFVLINCKIGSEQVVIRNLKETNGIKEVRPTIGSYDILAKLESPTIHDLREIIIKKIHKLDDVSAIRTLIGKSVMA